MKKTFREAADTRLSALHVDQQLHDRIRDGMIQSSKPSHLRLKPRLAIVLALIMVLGLVAAFALTQGFGLIAVWQIKEANRAPISSQAQKLVRSELAKHQFEHTEVAIQEALYDGRMLRVLYSVRDLNADKPFAPPGSELPPDFMFTAADQDGISWQTLDGCLVDDVPVSAVGITGNIAGELNGQVLTISQFDLSDVPVKNPFSVLLPIAGPDTPESLRFELPSSPLSGVVQLPLPEPLVLPDRSLQVTDAIWSPIRTYISLEITMNAGVPEPICHETLWRWTMDAKLTNADTSEDYPLADVGSGYTNNMEPAPDIGDFRFRVLDSSQPVTMTIHLEFASPDEMPQHLLLSAGEESLTIPTAPSN